MALIQRLEIRQGHALVMTPQLMQAIKLLQLCNLDLATYVEGELERNPLLERTGDDEAAAGATPPRLPPSTATAEWSERRSEPSIARPERPSVEPDDMPPADADAVGLALQRGRRRPAIPNGPAPAPAPPAARTATTISKPSSPAETTLADHLAEQLALAVTDPARRMIGQYLIDLVDEAGYLAGDLAAGRREARRAAGRGRGGARDPAGLRPGRRLRPQPRPNASRIQLRERDRFDPAMQALIGHLDLLARRDLAALRKICGVDDEDLADMIAEIRQLNPEARPRLRHRRWCSRSCPTCSCGPARTAPG